MPIRSSHLGECCEIRISRAHGQDDLSGVRAIIAASVLLVFTGELKRQHSPTPYVC